MCGQPQPVNALQFDCFTDAMSPHDCQQSDTEFAFPHTEKSKCCERCDWHSRQAPQLASMRSLLPRLWRAENGVEGVAEVDMAAVNSERDWCVNGSEVETLLIPADMAYSMQ